MLDGRRTCAIAKGRVLAPCPVFNAYAMRLATEHGQGHGECLVDASLSLLVALVSPFVCFLTGWFVAGVVFLAFVFLGVMVSSCIVRARRALVSRGDSLELRRRLFASSFCVLVAVSGVRRLAFMCCGVRLIDRMCRGSRVMCCPSVVCVRVVLGARFVFVVKVLLTNLNFSLSNEMGVSTNRYYPTVRTSVRLLIRSSARPSLRLYVCPCLCAPVRTSVHSLSRSSLRPRVHLFAVHSLTRALVCASVHSRSRSSLCWFARPPIHSHTLSLAGLPPARARAPSSARPSGRPVALQLLSGKR